MRWRRRDERGSILPMAIFIVVVAVGFTAFAVDLGLQRVARRDMQAVADVVALDLVRHIEGHKVSELEGSGSIADGWTNAIENSVSRNNDTVGSVPEVDVVLGTLKDDGEFEEVFGEVVPTAVRVIAGTDVAFAFAPGGGSATRSAIATLEASGVCFSVGSFAAQLDTSEGALTSLLLGMAGAELKVLSTGSIAELDGLSIPLLDLQQQLALLGTGTLVGGVTTVGDFILATAHVLQAQGDSQFEILEEIAGKLDTPDTVLNIDDILNLGTGGGSALDASVNAFDLVTGALFVAGKGHAVSVPALAIDLPIGLAGVTAKLTVLEPPQIACGGLGTVAHSAQVRVDLSADVLNGTLGGLVGVNLDLDIELAAADGTLTAMQCGDNGVDAITIEVVSSALEMLLLKLRAMIVLIFIPVSVPIADVELLNALSGTSAPVTLNYPALPSTDLPSATVTSSVNMLGLGNPANMDIRVLGLPLGLALAPLLAVLDPLLFKVLQPIFKLLGLSIGGADIAALSHPICGAPSLQG